MPCVAAQTADLQSRINTGDGGRSETGPWRDILLAHTFPFPSAFAFAFASAFCFAIASLVNLC